ncbi:3-oxoacyl-[acyl-carrier-protein] synthase III C-terminal domain-containing protein [Rhodococcus sp. 1168]|uniref:3-oxoacyl-ACP synthase III family protein n=1 Tax=Rhodococcus sp. 1168 TaxID=2018041 RepID=UPI000B5AFAA7|nr:3-oxoacyl-[acyl-carrier-protein] synthase III C-terminal domain-containing protein [Rhodococcus sp. 1168]
MGIVDFTVELPNSKVAIEEFLTHPDMTRDKVAKVIRSGQLSVLGEEQSPWGLGSDAAIKLLQRNNIDPSDIGTVIYAGSADWGVPFWSPAAKIAAELSIPNAICYEISNFCNAGFLALTIADKQTRSTGRPALVVIADRLSQLVDRSGDLIELFNFADAAAAVLVSDTDCRYQIIGSAMRTDPTWVDSYYGSAEGDQITIKRGPKADGLAEAFTQNFTELTAAALTQAGHTVADVAYFLVTHGNIDLHIDYLEALGVEHNRTVFNYDSDGHLGGADPLLALEGLEMDNALQSGELIVVATAGSGFSWGVTVLKTS